MAQVIFSAEALADLERLAEFLAEQAPDSAPGMLERVIDAAAILENHPLVGRRAEGEFRELVISRGNSGYLCLYVFDDAGDVVRILRIRHQREAGYRE